MSLDLIEKKLLAQLDENSRAQSSDIAKQLKTSRQVVDYRIQQLFKKGILLHCITLINPFQFVNNIWHTYVKLQSLTKKIEQDILKFLQDQKQIWWIAKCQGEWDMIFSTAGDTVQDIDITLQEFRKKFSQYINEEQTTNMIDVVAFPRGYFINKPTKKQSYIQPLKRQNIDEKDKAILRILVTDARLPATKIAAKTGLSARQVIYRIKELIKKGAISTFKTHIALKTINYDYYKVCFYAQQYTQQIENKLIYWCENNPYAIYFIRKIAPWTFEIEFETPSYKELNNTLSELRNLFGDIIKRSQTIIITDEYKGELNILDSIRE